MLRKRAQLGTIPLETVLPYIGKMNKKGNFQYQFKVNNQVYTVKTGSQRLRLFLNNRTCVICGRVGTHFVLEQDHNHTNPHLNLYSDDKILMTKDHIIPRSKGGKDCMSNYQTMCLSCNAKKADTYDTL